jgi:23S rRNA (adenine2503-C2)-methyltransferase
VKEKQDICSSNLKEIESWCVSEALPLFRAGQIYEWLWKKNARSFNTMTSLPLGLREKLEEEFLIRSIVHENKLKSADGAIKYSYRLIDGNIIEAVLIPALGRTTACVSTQAGCPLGCKFCATGIFGFHRNLSASEIFDQVAELNKISLEKYGHTLSNIVYMGMGEPLLNTENTLVSIEHLTDDRFGLGMSPQRITVSTAGIIPEIIKLGDAGIKFHLAVSLHTANQEKREQMMPVAKKYPLSELSEAIKYFHRKTRIRITFEYLLLHDFNDSIMDAGELAAFCLDFPVKINIIEYNEVPGINYKRSSAERMAAFKKFLESKNIIVNIRQSRGRDIAAACGQLANKEK